MLDKRTLLGGGLMMTALAAAAPVTAAVPQGALGQIGKITAKPGSEAALRKALADAAAVWSKMAACLGYYVCEDVKTEGLFLVTELWSDPGAHDRAMASPEGSAVMAANRPHFGHFELVAAFKPIAGAMRSIG